jgi:hypothetical protein
LGLRWQVRPIAFDGAFDHPLLDDSQFLDGQPAFISKITVAGLRGPGRHETSSSDLSDLPRAFAHLLIG